MKTNIIPNRLVSFLSVTSVLFFLVGCSSKSDVNLEEDLISLEVKMAEMLFYPNINKFNVQLSFSDNKVEEFEAVRFDDSTFRILYSKDKYSGKKSDVTQVECFFDNDAAQEQFSNVAFSIPSEGLKSNYSGSLPQELELFSVTFDNSDNVVLKSTSATNCYFFLFVNRCNPGGDASNYHEVLRYKIRFSLDNIPLDGPGDGLSYEYQNFGSEQGRELLIVGPLLDWDEEAPPFLSENVEDNESISLEIVPYDLSGPTPTEGDAIKGVKISAEQWNAHLSGSTSFIHLLIGCPQP